MVVHLGWVGFDLNVPPCCPAAQQIQPNSHLPKHNLAGSGMTQIYVNQTQSTTTSPSLYSQVTLVLLNDRVQKRLDDLYFRALLLHEVDRGHYVSQSGELDLSDSNTHFPLHIFARIDHKMTCNIIACRKALVLSTQKYTYNAMFDYLPKCYRSVSVRGHVHMTSAKFSYFFFPPPPHSRKLSVMSSSFGGHHMYMSSYVSQAALKKGGK